jgi:hypothetical protein
MPLFPDTERSVAIQDSFATRSHPLSRESVMFAACHANKKALQIQ